MKMDSHLKWILTFMFIVQVCEGNERIAQRLEHHIKKRSLTEDGFGDFRTATVQISNEEGTNGNHLVFKSSRRFRDNARFKHIHEPVVLSFGGEDMDFQIKMTHAKPVISKNARIKAYKGNQETKIHTEWMDCYLYGTVNDNKTQTAVISYCDGLAGWFTIANGTYNMETIDDTDGVETVAIAKGTTAGVYDDVKASHAEYKQKIRDSERRRQKRSGDPIVVEILVILDQQFLEGLIERGYETEQQWFNFMTLKWIGVQKEWGDPALEQDVQLDVEELIFFIDDPAWYVPTPSDLGSTLNAICINGMTNEPTYNDFDHIHLFSTTENSVRGKANVGGICQYQKKCAVSTGFDPLSHYVTAHELGHCFGLDHDLDVGCGSADGLMGYVATTGWSICSIEDLASFLRDFKSAVTCLYEDGITLPDSEGVDVIEAYPGMVYNDDEMCKMLYDDDYVYKDESENDPYGCVAFSCINMNRSSEQYGVSYRESDPVAGRYCADEMVCSWGKINGQYQCIDWNDTNIEMFPKIQGGWTEWSSVSSCSRTCGSGVQYRQRTCTDPAPQNAPRCEGIAFTVELCNTEPCADDSSDESEVIKQRAGETCTHWKTNSLFEAIDKVSSNYLNTGSAFSSVDLGQCEVKCDTIDGYNAGSKERHGLMPDGTQCNPSSLTSNADIWKLPRWSGMTGRCIMGQCQLLDCANVTGDLRNDGCGKCDGDNSTCQPFDGVYDTNIAKGVRDIITILPANASLIQFHFPYDDMKKYYIELLMKDDKDGTRTKVISSSTVDTTANPVSFAGTHWYFVREQQSLHAYEPLNQAVYVQVYNNGDANNSGIYYGFSLPPADEMDACSGVCENGGTWNQDLCSCECAAGFYGLDCTDTCWKFCKNSQPFKSSGCKCECGDRTYGTSCDCQYPFTGIDCSECKITECQNGGTFISAVCRCACPPGYGDLDCSTPCEDASGDTDKCLTNVNKGWCESNNEKMEADCYKSCGLCEPGPPTTSSSTTSTSTTPTPETTPTAPETTPTAPETTPTAPETTPTVTKESTLSPPGSRAAAGATDAMYIGICILLSLTITLYM